MEEHVRLLEEQVSSLKRVSEADRDELSKLHATVAELDREKDELQIAVDEKTEQEASRVDAVANRVSHISTGLCHLAVYDALFYRLILSYAALQIAL